MPELPDVVLLARSMNNALVGRTIFSAKVNQPKVLISSPLTFRRQIRNKEFVAFSQRGKWVLGHLKSEWTFALNLGMGGEVRLHSPIEIPDSNRERIVLLLDSGQQLWIHFWWFGHVHLIAPGKLQNHSQIGTLGPEPLSPEFSRDELAKRLEGRRGRIKSYLLDQRFIAGIGNVYVQDILWHAQLHPSRKANTLTQKEISNLHSAIQVVLKKGIKFGPGPGEHDVWGNRGQWRKKPGWPAIAYLTGNPCPLCQTTIEEIRVGSTTSYICPKCQSEGD
jgi:formamidopyrimidine-DNA glycosylase